MHTGLDKRLMRQLKTYGLEDLPIHQEKSTPLGIVHFIVTAAATPFDPRIHYIVDLITIGFYFCLRFCKYTKFNGHRQTVQFRPLMDFVFFVGDFLLPGDAPADHFCHATQIVITLNNQKNSICGETAYHFRSDSSPTCSVKASIDIFLHLRDRGCDPTTPISNFLSNHGICPP